jgi:hypothetical protein
MSLKTVALLWIPLMVGGCRTYGLWHRPEKDKKVVEVQIKEGSFAADMAFLQAHTPVVIIKDRSGKGQVAVLPKMQGRVMTSTAEGPDGLSFGWINRDLVASGRFVEHMNAFGGEDRFWLGPEGGQFSIFFAQGDPFDFEHWHTPAAIDTESWNLTGKSAHSVMLEKTMQLTNYSGAVFNLRVHREVRVLGREEALRAIGVSVTADANMVAFESNNRLVNTGPDPWTKKTGLLSIWILGMFTPSPATTIVIPYVPGPVSELGPVVKDDYFGKVPPDRLVIGEGVLFFRGDGQYRSKIGLSPQRARNVAGSYDAANRVLTIVQYNKPQDATEYVNSAWELQAEPYRGDVVNSYNDGPASPGAEPMGPFYELETSSPAAALRLAESILHTHSTFHFTGTEAQLDPIARVVLGTSIAEIKAALP